MTASKGQSEGPSTDRHNQPVVDPTKNVLELVAAANKRQDDLRAAEKELSDCKHEHQKELMRLDREAQKCSVAKDRVHAKELRKAESQRLDAIRRVDREDANKRAADAQTAIATLAKGTSDAAEALRQQVASVEKAVTAQRIADTAEISKRVGALELSSSEGKGKQAMADPALVELVQEVKNLARDRSEGSGRSKGVSMIGAIVIGASLLIANIIAIGIGLVALMKPAPVQPVAVPIVTPASRE